MYDHLQSRDEGLFDLGRTSLVQGGLEANESSPEALWMNLVQQKDDVMFGFMENAEKYFDELDTGQPGEAPDD